MPKPTPQTQEDISDIFLWVFRVGIACTLTSALLFLLGFATDHWHKDKYSYYGLWNKCEHGQCHPHQQSSLPDYHTATQALQILATIIYTLAPVIHFFVFWAKKKKSTDYRTRIFEAGYTFGTIFHVVGVIVFGSLHPNPDSLSWSYSMSVAGAGLAVIGTILVIVSRNKALRFFHCLPLRSQKQSRGRVDALSRSSTGSSRADTPQSGSSSDSRRIFGPQTRQSIESQSSILVAVPNYLNHSDSSFVTPVSRQAYPSSFRTMSPGPSSQIPFRTMPNNPHQKQLGATNPVLQYPNKPSTSKVELAPLRTHFLPPLLETTPV
ncbi:unnamed protein product [Candidula unifasciata]|uniref:Uncharacterized protein n=1 Tax=Candidula unifasciata TaxID=100452 RepID=A0A8S3YZC1_9EUPU|nr:unnamed protein product [Candidula unifasciata]